MSTISNLPNRRTIRLSNYDYSQEGSYFITIVTQDRIHLFGNIEDGKMMLNSVGKILEDEWRNTIQLRPNIALGEFIIMPDHMHMIITITAQLEKKEDKEWIHSNPKSPSQTIGAIIRGFKGASTKKINLFLNSTGASPFAPIIESPFAPTTESPFAPIIESPFAPTTELPFAPTNSQFAPKEFYKNKIFQRNYYEHIIRNQNDYNRIEQYILDNPKNWKKKKLKIDQ
jgi:REP element-mobilizing transposase RayT